MIMPYVMVGVPLLIGAGCAHGVVHWYRKARMMSRWPTVPGVITSDWDTLYNGKIRYSYQVRGKQYVGRRVFWQTGESSADRSPQVLTETYPPGNAVTVYYDPRSPKTSVLEPWNRQNMYASLLFAIAFTGFGLMAYVVAHHNGAI
jgi:hypothetical protein